MAPAILGCAGVLAVIAFVITLVVLLFTSDAPWSERLAMAAMPAGMAFLAALLLGSRDAAKYLGAMRSERNRLLASDETSNDDFLAVCPYGNVPLLISTRQAIANFFHVPVERIGRELRLTDDLHVKKFEPSFQLDVVNSVIASQRIQPQHFSFSMAGLETIDDLADAIQRVIDGFKQNAETHEST